MDDINNQAIALAMTKYNNDINIKEKLRDGVFEIQKNFVIPDDLEEENASTADAIVQSYKESKNDLWIQKYMENPNYDILNVESNGDCLFAVIRDAYKENGKKTTVSVLRAIVANELTKSIFDSHRNLYQEFLNEKINLEKEIKGLKIEIESPETKEKIQNEKVKEKKKKMIADIKSKVEYARGKLEELEYCKKNLEEYKHMKNINTIEGYQKYIMTSNYWADAWAIHVLEQNLKMKMIIFAEQEYENGNKVNVIQCGYSLPENVNSFTPEFYIMTSYSGNHYRLISYKRKKLLKFSEIPYHVKILIVKKCLEKNAGIYNLIQDFRDFKSRLHVNEREELPMIGGSDYYDSDIVFSFHNSSNHTLPGKGVNENEKIPDLPETLLQFAHLDKIDHWRRKLDDSWEQVNLLRLDNKTWKSVDHYVLGSQYKKAYPDIYLKFSLDSESDISKNLSLAKSSIMKDTVTVNGEIMKGKKDASYNEKENRELAVRAKFTQNEDFKNILLSTKFAILQKYISGDSPILDHFLMKLRKELS